MPPPPPRRRDRGRRLCLRHAGKPCRHFGGDEGFFDRCYYPALEKINGRPYATLICAGSDGSNAARQIARIATGWRLRQVAEPLIVCTHAQTPEAILAPKLISARDLDRCRELGTQVAAGIALGIY